MIWTKFEYLDISKREEKKNFTGKRKTSFNSVIECGNKLSSIEELMKRHTIPY